MSNSQNWCDIRDGNFDPAQLKEGGSLDNRCTTSSPVHPARKSVNRSNGWPIFFAVVSRTVSGDPSRAAMNPFARPRHRAWCPPC
jgi:hypothetical protein